MNQATMRIGQIYDEEKGEWNVRAGDIIFWNDKLWMVCYRGRTTLHNHPYIEVTTYKAWVGRISRKIYGWEAKQIKNYWKVEEKE